MPAKLRRSSAWLLLDLMRQGVKNGDDGLAIREAFYNRRLSDGVAYDRVGATIDRWRAFQANEFAHIALEALLNGLLALQLKTTSDGVEPEPLVRQLLDEIGPLLSLNGRSWVDWAVECGRDLEGQEEKHADLLFPALQNPDALAGDADVWAAAVRLIGVLYARWSSAAAASETWWNGRRQAAESRWLACFERLRAGRPVQPRTCW